VNVLPEMDAILRQLRSFTDKYSIRNGYGQTYTYTHCFSSTDNCKMCWDIDKARLIIQYKKIPVQRLQVDLLASSVSEAGINRSYLKKASANNEPIIVAYLNMFEKMVILDGNHRVMSRYKKGFKEIDAYVLKPHDHYFALIDDRSRALYLVTSAMKSIGDYLQGDISKKSLMQYVRGLENFYSFSVEKEMKEMLAGIQRADFLQFLDK